MSENTWDESYLSISTTTSSRQSPAVEKPEPIDDEEFENFPYLIPKDLMQVLSDSMEESIQSQSSQLSISDTSGSDRESLISCQISLRSPLLSVRKQFQDTEPVSPGSGLSDDESQAIKVGLRDSEDDKDCGSLDSKFLLLENSSSSATESVSESVIVSMRSSSENDSSYLGNESEDMENSIISYSSEYNGSDSEEKPSDEWEPEFFSKESIEEQNDSKYGSEEEWSKSGGKSDGTDSSSASEL